MKLYKTVIVFAALLCVGLGMQPVAQAALSEGESQTFTMDPVSFYLYDLDGSGSATLSANTLSGGQNPGYYLQYSTNGTDFYTLSTSTPVAYNVGSDLAQVFFRLHPTNGNASPTDTGNVTFQNYDYDVSTAEGLDLFQALYVNWNKSGQFTITISSSDDRFSPVPIPASALLLVSGLIGLVGFRRQMKNQ